MQLLICIVSQHCVLSIVYLICVLFVKYSNETFDIPGGWYIVHGVALWPITEQQVKFQARRLFYIPNPSNPRSVCDKK